MKENQRKKVSHSKTNVLNSEITTDKYVVVQSQLNLQNRAS